VNVCLERLRLRTPFSRPPRLLSFFASLTNLLLCRCFRFCLHQGQAAWKPETR
jgi:hypothetical protein